jgi:hypothetical protein
MTIRDPRQLEMLRDDERPPPRRQRPTLSQARRQAEIGMALAEDNANRTTAMWSERAYEFLVTFARTHETFISEDVSFLSKEEGFPQPRTDRAWGSVYRRAIKARIIVQDGTGRSTRRHASLCPRWHSCFFPRLA